MPFTVAHAAAVLPLHKWVKSRLPLSALMVGSMSPDFTYFVPYAPARVATHDLAGLFSFCWPAGLAVWLIYVRLLERPTIALLPDAWRTRLEPTGPITPALLLRASIAIVLGAATHVIWDAFTHRSTPVTDVLPALRETWLEFGTLRVPLYKLLQHLSSLVGMTALAIWAMRLRRRAPMSQAVTPREVSARTRISAAAVLVTGSFAVAVVYYLLSRNFAFEGRIFYFAIGGMTGWALAWCAVAVWVRRTVLAGAATEGA